MFKPQNGRILVKPDPKTNETEFGIILPEDKDKPVTGTVIVGGVDTKEGDRVLFSKFGFDEVEIEKEVHYVVSEQLVLGIFQ